MTALYMIQSPNTKKKKNPSPRKRKRGQFVKKETGAKEDKKRREENRIKGIHHRRRTASPSSTRNWMGRSHHIKIKRQKKG